MLPLLLIVVGIPVLGILLCVNRSKSIKVTASKCVAAKDSSSKNSPLKTLTLDEQANKMGKSSDTDTNVAESPQKSLKVLARTQGTTQHTQDSAKNGKSSKSRKKKKGLSKEKDSKETKENTKDTKETRETKGETKGETKETRGETRETRETRGETRETKGESRETRGGSRETRGETRDTRETKDSKEQERSRKTDRTVLSEIGQSNSSRKDKTIDFSKTKKAEKKKNKKKWAKRMMDMKFREIGQQFNDKVKKYVAPDLTSDAYNANESKNRYPKILCYDQTRVVLKGRKEKDDYIHASWVTIPGRKNKYICTQGPLKETSEHFWWMIFQEKVPVILMLCRLKEGDKGDEKCADYWPQKPGEEKEYGTLSVKCVEIKEHPVQTTKWTVISVSNGETSINVSHIFVSDWPDHLAPANPEPIVKLFKWLKNHNEGKPVVVHCSAGVGRTSTFVGIDYADVRIGADGHVSLSDIVKEMRGQRFQAMQTQVQYMFLVACLLEYYAQEEVIPRDEKFKMFMRDYERFARKKQSKGHQPR